MDDKHTNNMIMHLAQELQHELYLTLGKKAPSVDFLNEFIRNHFRKYGEKLVKEEKIDNSKLPALLKEKPSKSESTRMRELAGIPHKGNFI